MRRWFGFIFLVGALLLGPSGPSAAVEWHFETLDGAGGPNGRVNGDVGANNAVTLYAGQPHVWYTGDGDLRHAWWTGTQWYFETLDGAGGPDGRIDAWLNREHAVTLYGGQPHIWYVNGDNGDLRHAWWDGTRWTFEILDGAGGPNGRIDSYLDIAGTVTLYNGQPHAWYQDAINGDLRHAWWDGTQWYFETLDGAGGTNGRTTANVGYYNAVTIYSGQPHVWYLDDSKRDQRHAWWTGTQWYFETLDGAGGTNGRIKADVGYYNAATLFAGQPHVWYLDGTNEQGRLRHAWWTGTQWYFETLDGAGGTNGRIDASVGYYNAVTLYGGQPHVWYGAFYGTNSDLRHAWWTGTDWSFETLDGAGGANGRIDAGVGNYNAVTLHGGQPHVWHWNFTNGNLRHAWWG